MKNEKYILNKLKKLEIKVGVSLFLTVALVVGWYFLVFGMTFDNFAFALTGTYTKVDSPGPGDFSLTSDDWNNLANDFLDKSGLAGDSMAGPLDMSFMPINRVQLPSLDDDAATKEYVDTMIAAIAGGPAGGGSVYINWGRQDCADSSGSVPVGVVPLYSGYTFSGMQGVGGGSDYKCMKDVPSLGSAREATVVNQFYPVGTNPIDVYLPPGIPPLTSLLCSKCYIDQICYVVDNDNVCNPGETLAYSGYIMTDSWNSAHSFDALCVNDNMDSSIAYQDNPSSVLTGSYVMTNSSYGSYPTNRYNHCAVCCL